MDAKAKDDWSPNPAVMDLWPDVSGNDINGLGQASEEAPTPVFWRTDGSVPHDKVMYYFYDRYRDNPEIRKARAYREDVAALADSEVADDAEDHTPGEWAGLVKAAALELGADDAGICAWREEWSYNDRPNPDGKWAILLAFAHDYDNLKSAPSESGYLEVMAQYGRAGMTAKKLANWIRDHGHPAAPKTGPMTEDILMIPPAIEAGLGELGKHGSMIHRRFGANFRLAAVLTDMPLVPDRPDVFGADMFCENCQVCSNACPPDAIFREKQTVRGSRKWYVDFDKCVPYFVDNESCGLCLAVCPWSRPGVADNLVAKMARRIDAEA